MEPTKTYFAHYRDLNNCAQMRTFKSAKLSHVLKTLTNISKNKDFAVFDFDTWNTSEPQGLVAFGSGNAWNTYYNNITAIKVA